jgi:pimeloyl-ACP methyl ester carboxylesterase
VFSKKFATYAWDARGFGESAAASPVNDFSQFSTDLKQVFDELGIAKAHLVGSSMGGRIALDFYEKHPERASSLILYDTFPGTNAWYVPNYLIRKFLNYRQKPLQEGKELSDISDRLASVITSKKTPPHLIKMIADGLASCPKQAYLKTIATLFDYQPVARLGKITVPTLVMVGSDDRITPPLLARYMAWKIPHSQFCKIKNAGHVANIERADEFNKAVLKFLKEIAPYTGD